MMGQPLQPGTRGWDLKVGKTGKLSGSLHAHEVGAKKWGVSVHKKLSIG